MDKSNIISDHIIPNVEGSIKPVGFIDTKSHSSTDDVLDEAVELGNELNADWIIGFNFQSQPTLERVNRMWKGFGTAVQITPQRG